MKVLCQFALACAIGAPLGAVWPAAAAGEPAARAAATPLAAQEAQLRMSLAQTAAVVARNADTLELRFPARLAFVPDGTELLPSGRELLDLLARSLRDYASSQVVVAVYSDAIGSEDYNRQQTQARAGAVVAYLQARGVAPARLVARGAGEGSPLEAPNTPEGRDLNRRIVFTITPLSS